MSGFDLIIQPDEDDADAAEILVDGAIGGAPYRFLLDTGAAKTKVGFDAYTSSFASVEANASSGIFASGNDTEVIIAPTIAVGPIIAHDFPVVRMAERGPERRGLIGMDLLKNVRLHFLFDEERVLVNPDESAAADSPFQGLFLDTRLHPYVAIALGEARANAVWDTGAGITVADMSFIERCPMYFQEVGRSTGTDSTGAEMETPMFLMAAPVIGGYTLAPHRVAGVDLSQVNATLERPMDLILGYTTLSKANWVFDFPRKRWAISKLLG